MDHKSAKIFIEVEEIKDYIVFLRVGPMDILTILGKQVETRLNFIVV